jgi:hypothetical protein
MKYPWVLQIGIGTNVQEFFVFSQVVYVVVVTRARARAWKTISSTDTGFTWQVIVHQKATINSTTYNHKVINLTTICGVYGLKTAKIAQNRKFGRPIWYQTKALYKQNQNKLIREQIYEF